MEHRSVGSGAPGLILARPQTRLLAGARSAAGVGDVVGSQGWGTVQERGPGSGQSRPGRGPTLAGPRPAPALVTRPWIRPARATRTPPARRQGAKATGGVVGSRHTGRSKHILALAIVAALAAGLLWGIGSALGASTSPSPAAKAVVLHVGTVQDADNLNPFIGYSGTAYEIFHLNYDLLVGYTPSNFAARPELATSWSHSADGNHLDLQHPPRRELAGRCAAHRERRRLHLQLHHQEQSLCLHVLHDQHQDGRRHRPVHRQVHPRQAQGRHAALLGADPAAAHLGQDLGQRRRHTPTSTSRRSWARGPSR